MLYQGDFYPRAVDNSGVIIGIEDSLFKDFNFVDDDLAVGLPVAMTLDLAGLLKKAFNRLLLSLISSRERRLRKAASCAGCSERS